MDIVKNQIQRIIWAVELFFVSIEFILAIALEAKINQDKGDELVYNDYGVLIPLDIYEGNALPWVHFALFAGVFGFVSLIGMFFYERTGKANPVVILGIQFLNWLWFLTAFSLEAVHVNALDYFCKFAYGELYVTQCSIPRAILGLAIIIWLLFFVSLGYSILGLQQSGALAGGFNFNKGGQYPQPVQANAPPNPYSEPPNTYSEPPNTYYSEPPNPYTGYSMETEGQRKYGV